MNSEAQKLTITGKNLVQIYGHTAQGSIHRTGKRDVQKPQNGYCDGQNTCVRHFHSRMVFRRETSVTMWRGFDVGTRRRIRKVWRKKATSLAKNHSRWNQATGPISATICSVLEAVWKPSTPGVWQATEASATLDGVLFNKAQIVESFSKDLVTQKLKKAAGHPLSTGMEKGVTTDFAKKARSQLIKEGNFMAARALDFLVCGAIHEPHLPADGSIPKQFFCVRCDQRALATRKHELWECPGNGLINHAHMKESDRLVTLAQKFLGHRSSFVCPWSFAV